MIDQTPPLSNPPCPLADELRIYVAGGFNEQRATEFEDHLLACAECETLLDRLDDPSDAVIQALVSLPSSPHDELAYQQLRETALAQPVEFANSAEATANFQLANRLADPDLGPLPHRLGNYELLACIGRGASGAVYRARHLKLDQTVAVKVLDPSRTLAAESFLLEMKTLGSLAHAHIVRATDAGEADGLHYLVMEYVEGIDAARVLFRHGPLRVADACDIVRQAALGLQFVHQRSLVHRDIKPSNLLVTVDGHVKLLDLGIAIRSDGQSPVETAATKPRGTLDYMAPELWINPTAVDTRTDLYSLGCTLYKLLIGKIPPNDLASDGESLASQPRCLQRVLQSLLAADPNDRSASVAEVSESLRPHCRGADLAKLVHKVAPDLARSASPPATNPRWLDQLPLSRRSAVAALAALGGATLLLPKLRFGQPPKLRRNEWRPLTPVAPALLLAPRGADQVQYDWSDDGEIQITAEQLALLHLGRPVNGLFALSVQMLPQDSGSGGVFFRGQFDYSQDSRTLHFQTVELLTPGEPTSMGGLHLLWSRWTAQRNGNEVSAHQTPLAEVAVELTIDPNGQTLQITCGRKGMPEIEWNGQPLHESMWQFSVEARSLQRLSTSQIPTAYLGRLGLLNTRGTATFLQPRLAYL